MVIPLLANQDLTPMLLDPGPFDQLLLIEKRPQNIFAGQISDTLPKHIEVMSLQECDASFIDSLTFFYIDYD